MRVKELLLDLSRGNPTPDQQAQLSVWVAGAAARSIHGDRDDIRRIQSPIGEVLLQVAGLVPTT
jgi:hypothetical protein